MRPEPDHIRAALLLTVWCVAAIALRWNAWMPDLSALLIASWLWEHGSRDLIYAMPPGFFGGAPAAWSPALDTLGIAGEQSYPYLYPPLWAALLAPVTQFASIQSLMNAALVLQVPLLAVSVLLAGRLAKPAQTSWTLWALWGVAVLSLSAPAFLALMHNQPSIFVGFVILWAFERLAAGRPAAFGALIAVAAAIKLSPAVFILAALMLRRGRAVVAFGVVGAGLAMVSIWLTGWPAHGAMLASLRAVSSQTLMIALNISLDSVVGQMWLTPDLLPASAPTPAALSLLGTGSAAGAAALLVWRVSTRPPAQRPLAALLGLSLVIWLLGPLGWLHYYVMPLLILPGLARLMPRRAAIPLGAVTVILMSMPLYLGLASTALFHTLYPALASGAWLAVLLAILWPQTAQTVPPRDARR